MSTTRGLRTWQRTFQQTFHSHRIVSQTPFAAKTPALVLSASRNHQFISSGGSRRCHSTESEYRPRPLTDRGAPQTSAPEEVAEPSSADAIALRKALSPAYQLWFTCKKCLERSGHTVSKQAYHHGTCVINCPKCKSQHLISDNLKIFSDTNVTMEDIAKEHGEKLKKGRLGADGDIEFYDEEAERKIEEGIQAQIRSAAKAKS